MTIINKNKEYIMADKTDNDNATGVGQIAGKYDKIHKEGTFKVLDIIDNYVDRKVQQTTGTRSEKVPNSDKPDISKMSGSEFMGNVTIFDDPETSLSNNVFGISRSGVGKSLATNKDDMGLVFFTRPQFNLCDHNLLQHRIFSELLDKDKNGLGRYVRCTLDPRMSRGGMTGNRPKIVSSLVDEGNPFISLLTNNVLTVSGWSDYTTQTWTSTAGMRGEQYTMVDGIAELHGKFDLDVTFRNTLGKHVPLLFHIWLLYPTMTHDGTIGPYMDYVIRNDLDYNTRIYRITLDETKRYVSEIAATGVSIPVVSGIGKNFDYTKDLKYTQQGKDLTIRFASSGLIYRDPILKAEFNETSATFNPSVRNMLAGRHHNLVKIPRALEAVMDNRGIPIIDTKTDELQWWVDANSPDLARAKQYKYKGI